MERKNEQQLSNNLQRLLLTEAETGDTSFKSSNLCLNAELSVLSVLDSDEFISLKISRTYYDIHYIL